MNRPIKQDVPRCEICHEPVGTFSFDIWALGTAYNATNPCEPDESSLDVSEEFRPDYIQVGNCCLDKLRIEWSSFIQRLEDWTP